MRKIVNYEERICDHCGKVKTKDISNKTFGVIDVFGGWFELSLKPTSLMDKDTTKDFCSLDCLAGYVRRD